MNPLSADLVSTIPDSACYEILAEITDVNIGQGSPAGEEIGTLSLKVIENFARPDSLVGDKIQIGYARMADPMLRAQNGFNQWNNIPLEPRSFLILAIKPVPGSPSSWEAVAGRAVASSESPEVGELRECYRIEKDVQNQVAMPKHFANAIISGKDLLRYYALEAISDRGLLPRVEAVSVIDSALTGGLPPKEKQAVAEYLNKSSLFSSVAGADPANVRIASILAREFMGSKNSDDARMWLESLAACILDDFSDDPDGSDRIRAALISSVKQPPAAEFISAVKKLMAESSPDEKEVQRDVVKAWSAANLK